MKSPFMAVPFSDFNTVEIDLALIRRLEKNAPRYTSYPTADRFVEAFNADVYRAWVAKRAIGNYPRPLSLYFHLPFCNSGCHFCACNKIVTQDRSLAEKYVEYLIRELEIQAALFGNNRRVDQLHWGGGTPTFLAHEQLRALMTAIRKNFDLAENGEYAIEVDPRSVSEGTVALLAELGFNRISLGVQDFDSQVQAAVNRVQSVEETLAVVDCARSHGFKSINIDLIYGLPRQTVIGFSHTLDIVLEARPQRLALYSYAHMPTLFKSQRCIDENELPAAVQRLDIFKLAIRRLTEAGYVYIGMDHFALPDDDMALAQRQGRLHRNFQGYSTHADCDLVGFGISAIGKIGASYSQNVRTLEEYYDTLDSGDLPILRGVELSTDDLVRRAVIHALMCQFEIAIESIELAYIIDFWEYFRDEIVDLRVLEQEGLLRLTRDWLSVTPKGRILIRSICMVFDKYLRLRNEHSRYSNVI